MANHLQWLFLAVFILRACNLAFGAQSFDLDVTHISRLPAIDHPDSVSAPEQAGWPSAGQRVVWTAHIRNWGTTPARQVTCIFSIDGKQAARVAVDIPPNGNKSVSLPWTWEFKRHDLAFLIDPENRFKESEEANNKLTVQTDALSAGFYVEQSLYRYFHTYQKDLKAGSNSFEDWAQRQLTMANRMFASAVTPETPSGVLDRWRLDRVVLVPDGALPLQGGEGRNRGMVDPNAADKSVDLIWGFPSSMLNGDTYRYHFADLRNDFYYQGSLIHELGHERRMYDVYTFRVYHDGGIGVVDIKQDGKPVAGTPLMPLDSRGVVYETMEEGLMNMTYTYVDRYSAAAFNLFAGTRARGKYGNTIINEELGKFLGDIPRAHRIRLVNPEGAPLINARLELFRVQRGPIVPTPFGQRLQARYQEPADFQGYTDSKGEVVFKGDPFRKPGETVFFGGTAILRVTYAGNVSFLYFELTAANRAFWRGQQNEARYELVVGTSPCTKAPANLRATRTAGGLQFSWSKVPGAYSYLVWASVDGRPHSSIGNSYSTSLTADIEGSKVNWFVEAYFDQCVRSVSARATFHAK